VRVWLSRKLAEFVDGIDLRPHHVGEAFDLEFPEAQLLIAEGYAAPDRRMRRDRRLAVRENIDRRTAVPSPAVHPA